MVAVKETERRIYGILNDVMDPEIPVLSLLDLGIVRQVLLNDDSITVVISPTYTGCPATDIIPGLIVRALSDAGFEKIEIKSELIPAWSTDWITEEGKARLKAYGIAPPHRTTDEKKIVQCPNCNSAQTKIISDFGSTLCKSLYRCLDCEEPFEAFKCI